MVIAMLLVLAGCKPGVPDEVIQPDDMEDILYDYYVAQGIATLPGQQSGSEDYRRDMYFNSVLNKHGVTRAEFDSSLVYYYTRADRFVEIYKNIPERMSDDALELGATEGEVEEIYCNTEPYRRYSQYLGRYEVCKTDAASTI